MKKNILMTLGFLIILTTSWISYANNWNDPRSLAQEYNDDINYTSPNNFVRKWKGHQFTICKYGRCSKQVGKQEVLQNQKQWKRDNPTSECTVTAAWWEGDNRLGFHCTNGRSDLLTFNKYGKVVKEEVRFE